MFITLSYAFTYRIVEPGSSSCNFSVTGFNVALNPCASFCSLCRCTCHLSCQLRALKVHSRWAWCWKLQLSHPQAVASLQSHTQPPKPKGPDEKMSDRKPQFIQAHLLTKGEYHWHPWKCHIVVGSRLQVMYLDIPTCNYSWWFGLGTVSFHLVSSNRDSLRLSFQVSELELRCKVINSQSEDSLSF